jgi:anti-sigma factor RsiW
MTHLTEAERQGAADGSLSEARGRRVAEHLAACAECDADVARLRRVVTLARTHRPPAGPLDELWPDIRARIERDKVVPLGTAAPPAPRRTPWARRRAWIVGVASAGLAAAAALVVSTRTPRPNAATDQPAALPRDGGPTFVSDTGDSAHAYQQEVQALLDEMALRRAMMRPDVAARMDHDVRVIDSAIAELQDALKHDPNNPALRQLLAASIRQKRDLLKRAEDAS